MDNIITLITKKKKKKKSILIQTLRGSLFIIFVFVLLRNKLHVWSISC